MKKQGISSKTFKKKTRKLHSFLLCPQLPINIISQKFRNRNDLNHIGGIILCPQLPLNNKKKKQRFSGKQ
jgi:hypothetical protein